MCGIIGAYAFDGFEKKSEEKARTEASIFITTQLLQMTVDRGKDATGISMLWADGNYSGLKMGIPSPSFIARFGEEETEFKGMMKLWREYPKVCKVFMGHCRKSSKGNSYDNINNHPIQVGDMIFVHNGTLNNDDIIFENLKVKRAAEVDSEAIGHLLCHYTNNGLEPFTKEVMDETTRRLGGTYSVIAASGNNPFQVAQFRDGRPAEFVFVKPLKTVFCASEKKFLENVLFEYNKFSQLFSVMNLPYLKKDDVQFKTMADDSYVIWDLTVPIEDDTDIEDLYDWAKTPLRVDKVWKSTTTTTTYGTGYQGNAYGTQKKTVVASSTGSNKTSSAKETTTGKDTDTSADTNTGVIWSKGLSKYKTSKGIEDTKKTGACVIDIEGGTVDYLAPEDGDDDQTLTQVDKDRVENILCGAASVADVSAVRIETALDEVKKPGESQPDDDNADTVEVDMNLASPAALKAASEYGKDLIKFKDEDEVIEVLDLNDKSVLEALPLHALVNRIAKVMFEKVFAIGYDCACAEQAPFNENTKLEDAERKIRGLKIALKLMGTSLADECNEHQYADTDVSDMFMDALAEVIKPQALARLNLDVAFTAGDLQNIPMLRELKAVVNEEKKKV